MAFFALLTESTPHYNVIYREVATDLYAFFNVICRWNWDEDDLEDKVVSRQSMSCFAFPDTDTRCVPVQFCAGFVLFSCRFCAVFVPFLC